MREIVGHVQSITEGAMRSRDTGELLETRELEIKVFMYGKRHDQAPDLLELKDGTIRLIVTDRAAFKDYPIGKEFTITLGDR